MGNRAPRIGGPAARGAGNRPRILTGVGRLTLGLAVVVIGLRASAQQLTAPAPPAGDTQALSARYRFQERYILTDNPAEPALLSQYKVATRETTKITREKPQGAPDVAQTELQSIYTERAAKLNNAKDGLVGEVVRHYDKVKLRSTVPFTRYKLNWLEGLTVLYRLQNRTTPQVLSLTDRQLRQQEFEHIVQQTFLPVLSTILPRKPARIGDRWPVLRPALWALVGEMPLDDGYDVTAELREIRPDEGARTLTAVIDVKGDFAVEIGASAVNAQLEFKFQPAEVKATGTPGRDLPKDQPAEAARGPIGLFDARGHISKIRMAQAITVVAPGSDGRLKQTVDRSLVLERRTPADEPGSPPPAPLQLPVSPPAPTVQNSWLLFDDPLERFHLLYPQDFQVKRAYPDGGIDLLDRRPDGQDVIQVNLVPKGDNPQRDRLQADPLQEKKLLEDDWRKKGEKVLPGPSGWLPDADWANLKRRVYRIEAALVPDPGGDQGPAPASGRIYMDRYIVQFASNNVIRVTAMTTRDPHIPFRDTAESLIKAFDFGPSEGVVRSAPSSRPAAPGSGSPPP